AAMTRSARAPTPILPVFSAGFSERTADSMGIAAAAELETLELRLAGMLSHQSVPRKESRMRRIALLLPVCLLVAPFGTALGQPRIVESQGQRIGVETVADGLEHPWGLAFLPDGAMLVTEKPGRLRIVSK